jgi:hypothetical protein
MGFCFVGRVTNGWLRSYGGAFGCELQDPPLQNPQGWATRREPESPDFVLHRESQEP